MGLKRNPLAGKHERVEAAGGFLPNPAKISLTVLTNGINKVILPSLYKPVNNYFENNRFLILASLIHIRSRIHSCRHLLKYLVDFPSYTEQYLKNQSHGQPYL
jgi:hypothetical protein